MQGSLAELVAEEGGRRMWSSRWPTLLLLAIPNNLGPRKKGCLGWARRLF